MSEQQESRVERVLDELIEAAERVGLKVRREKLMREVGYRARGGHCRLHVCSGRRGDDDDVHVPARQRVAKVGCDVAVQAQLLPHLVGAGVAAADECDDPGARHFREGPRVKPGDHAAADDGNAEHKLLFAIP